LTGLSRRPQCLFPGYHTVSEALDFMPESDLNTVGAILEKKQPVRLHTFSPS